MKRFNFVIENEFGERHPGYIEVGINGLEIHLEGYGTAGMAPGYGSPILIDTFDGDPTVVIWADINQEDPTHKISLEDARE